MGDDEPSHSGEIGISLINPQAHRVPGGVWNEDTLPILNWEDAERRVVIPADLQIVLGCPSPVLRWAMDKFLRVQIEHSQPIEQQLLESPSAYLGEWQSSGLEPGKSDKWRVFFQVGQRWCVAVIGRDRNGNYNVVTMHYPSDRNYLPNMIAKGHYIVRT